MTTTAAPTEQRFVLDGVDWELYELLLRRMGDRHIFVTYDRGRLELMSPSWKHDKRARSLGLLVSILAEELGIPIEGGGSTTFRREDLARGLEPDQCFYVGNNVDRVRGKDEIDLSCDPPPDLAIEVEISQRLLERVSIYAALGIGELWRDDGQHVRAYQLGADGEYRQQNRSAKFPMLPLEQVDQFLELRRTLDEMNWMRTERDLVRKNLAGRSGSAD
jgi:Uma2 family endonuclease